MQWGLEAIDLEKEQKVGTVPFQLAAHSVWVGFKWNESWHLLGQPPQGVESEREERLEAAVRRFYYGKYVRCDFSAVSVNSWCLRQGNECTSMYCACTCTYVRVCCKACSSFSCSIIWTVGKGWWVRACDEKSHVYRIRMEGVIKKNQPFISRQTNIQTTVYNVTSFIFLFSEMRFYNTTYILITALTKGFWGSKRYVTSYLTRQMQLSSYYRWEARF